jgi:hypothetical protein
MAKIKTQFGVVEKEPVKLSDVAAQQNQNTPISPSGAAALQDTTAKQQDMAGTPAQTAAALEDTRRKEAPSTLSQAERYAQPTAPSGTLAQEAKDKALTLQQLGPVRSRVQALIEQRLQSAQTATSELGINQEAIEGIQDLDKRQETEQAFTQYLANPTESNLQTIYDTVGSSALEDIATYFQGVPESIKQAIAPQIVGNATVADLSLEELGTSIPELASTLQVDEATLQGMSLNDLNSEIDALQAAELSNTDQATAILYSPTSTPQQRQAAIATLRQLGVAGIPGAEQAVERVQQQINDAQTIEIAGRELSLEEALSDEGISALVTQASYDDNILNKLKEDPRYADLANWISENKNALMSLATEYEGEAQDFLKVQDEWQQVKTTLGEGGDALLSTILGKDLANSILSTELDEANQKLSDSPLYQAVVENDILREDLKSSPEVAQEMIDNNLSQEEIENSARVKEVTEADSYIASLLGKEGYLTNKSDIVDAVANLDKINAISPSVLNRGRAYQDVLNIDLLEDIDSSDDPDEIFTDIDEYNSVKKRLDTMEGRDEVVAGTFGSSDWSANDLNWAIKNAPQETVDAIKAVFDLNNDGTITEEEIQSPEVEENIRDALGENLSIEDIVGLDGKYDPAGVADKLAALNVDKSTYENAIGSEINKAILQKEREIDNEIQQNTNAVTKAKDTPQYQEVVAMKQDPAGTSERFSRLVDEMKVDPALKDILVIPDFTKLEPGQRYDVQAFYSWRDKVREAMDESKRRHGSFYFKLGSYQALSGMYDMMNKWHKYLQTKQLEKSTADKIKQLQDSQSALNTQRSGLGDLDEEGLTNLAGILGVV